MENNKYTTRTEFIEMLAKKRAVTKVEAEAILKDTLDVLMESCKQSKGVMFKGLFTLTKTKKSAREGVMNGIEWKTPEKFIVKFKTGQNFEDYLN